MPSSTPHKISIRTQDFQLLALSISHIADSAFEDIENIEDIED